MLTGSDGYQYKDLAARLLNQPLENEYNNQVRGLKKIGYSEKKIEIYIAAYNATCGPDHYRHNAGWRAISNRWPSSRTRKPNPLSSPSSSVHPAH